MNAERGRCAAGGSYRPWGEQRRRRSARNIHAKWMHLDPSGAIAQLTQTRLMSHLLRSQLNELYRTIESAKFNPSEFVITSEDELGFQTETIEYVGLNAPAEETYDFTIHIADLHCYWRPGLHSKFDNAKLASWQIVRARFGNWLACLRRELDSPDLWGDFERIREFVKADANAPGDDEPLSSEEQTKLIEGLGKVRELVAARPDLPEAQRSAMNDAVDRIEATSKRFTRKEVLAWILSAVITQVISKNLTWENGQWLARQILESLGALHVLGEHVFQALAGV